MALRYNSDYVKYALDPSHSLTMSMLECILTGCSDTPSCLDIDLIAISSTSDKDGLEPNTSPNQAPPIIA